MKQHIFLVIFLSFLTCEAFGQWKGEAWDHTLAYGVHDTNLFGSFTSDAGTDVSRYTFNSGWTEADAGINLSNAVVTSFASFGRYVFAGQTNNLGDVNWNSYKSSDNGGSWQNSGGSPIAANGTYLFSSSSTTVYRSNDSGSLTSWQGVPCPAASAFGIMGYHIFATTSGGLYRSTDTGMHWSQLTYPLSPPVAFAVVDTVIFAGSSSGATGIAMSTDSGGTWQSIGFPHSVTALATDGKNLWAGTTDSGVYISTDRGQHWRNVSDGLKYYLQVTAMAVFDTMMIVGTVSPGSQNYYQAWRPIREMTSPPDAVAEPQPSDTIQIFPNPSTGNVTIFSGSTSIYSVRVLNVLGEEVLNMPNERESNLTLDLSKLPSGTYFLQIQTADATVLRKVVRE